MQHIFDVSTPSISLDSKSFSLVGAGTSVFGTPDSKSGDDASDSDDDTVDQGPHVHFEPLVQLPEAVDLKRQCEQTCQM